MATMSSDAVIAGAGLTGRLMALALAHQGISCTIVDRSPHGGLAQDDRTTALAYASVRLFMRLGLWAALKPLAEPINDILVTNGVPKDRFRRGGLSGDGLHFPSSLLPADRTGEHGTPLGYIVDNAAMNRDFEAAAQASPLIVTHYGDGIDSTQRHAEIVSVRTNSGKTIETPLLIACDGKASRLRRSLGFRHLEWGYGQKAIIFNIAHTEDHKGVAEELFYPAGPFAILPLRDRRSSIVWTEKTAAADALLALSDDDFLTETQTRVGNYLGTLNLSSKRAAFPLKFGYAPVPALDRVALAGDASHSIHPIAGQGFNLGIKDVATMSDVLGTAKRTGLDIGHGTVLDEYVRWRRFDTATMAFGTDALNRLFSNDIAPIRWARSFGLGMVNKFDPLRIAFMRQSGADTGTLPSLMQPF